MCSLAHALQSIAHLLTMQMESVKMGEVLTRNVINMTPDQREKLSNAINVIIDAVNTGDHVSQETPEVICGTPVPGPDDLGNPNIPVSETDECKTPTVHENQQAVPDAPVHENQQAIPDAPVHENQQAVPDAPVHGKQQKNPKKGTKRDSKPLKKKKTGFVIEMPERADSPNPVTDIQKLIKEISEQTSWAKIVGTPISHQPNPVVEYPKPYYDDNEEFIALFRNTMDRAYDQISATEQNPDDFFSIIFQIAFAIAEIRYDIMIDTNNIGIDINHGSGDYCVWTHIVRTSMKPDGSYFRQEIDPKTICAFLNHVTDYSEKNINIRQHVGNNNDQFTIENGVFIMKDAALKSIRHLVDTIIAATYNDRNILELIGMQDEIKNIFTTIKNIYEKTQIKEPVYSVVHHRRN
jgi:hypothetical protein